MLSKQNHYFASGNTATGFFSFHKELFEPLEQMIVVDGIWGTEKTSLLERIAKKWNEQGYNVECYHCPLDPNELTGIIAREINRGVVESSSLQAMAPTLPLLTGYRFDLNQALSEQTLQENRQEIKHAYAEWNRFRTRAYDLLADALRIHDDWERIYIDRLDRQAARRMANELNEQIFQDAQSNAEQNSAKISHSATEIRRFFGAATANGAVDFIQQITDGCIKRYFIKGRPGSGKSTLLQAVRSEAKRRGFSTEVYHCGLDPRSIDMVIIRELNIALFDSTPPHEYDPSKESDVIIDTYQLTIAPGTDEKYAPIIKQLANRYKATIKNAITQLEYAVAAKRQLDELYQQAIDPLRLQSIHDEILKAALS